MSTSINRQSIVMEDIIEEIVTKNPKEYGNFTAVYFAILYTVEGLQEYVEDILGSVKKDVYIKTAGLSNCSINCSRKYGRTFVHWCSTCATWKHELKKYNKSTIHWDKVQWNNIDSQAWSYSIQEISKCFLKDPTIIGKSVSGFGVLKDLNNLMSLFRNLKTCDIDNRTTIDRVSDIRNKHYGHNLSGRVFEPDKIYSIDALSNLLSHPSIQLYESAKSSLKRLSILKKSNRPLETIIGPNFQVTHNQSDIINPPKESELSSDEVIEAIKLLLMSIKQQDQNYTKEETDQRKTNVLRKIPFSFLLRTAFILLFFFLGVMYAIYGLSLSADENNPEGKYYKRS